MSARTATAAPPAAETTIALLRRGLLGLALLTMLGIALELIIERHWTQPIMLVAWVALALLGLAVGLIWRAPSGGRVRAAQLLALVVLISAALGIREHIEANHEAGPLDYRYAQTWDGLSSPTRWWLAARKVVGPSPPLAPGALAQAALCLLLATARHPALRGARGVPARETPVTGR